MMKNKVLFLLAGVLALSSTAFAEAIHFNNVEFRSDYVPGAGRIRIRSQDDGKIWIHHDRNACSPDGRICTKMAFAPQIVEAKVIEDNRPADGDLVLQLTPEVKLSVGSGFNPKGLISYDALVSASDGTEIRVPLIVNVYTKISK